MWEDHFLKPSTCPHAAEMGALREVACDNIISRASWSIIIKLRENTIFNISACLKGKGKKSFFLRLPKYQMSHRQVLEVSDIRHRQ